ncbi:MAG: methylmalonyl-CoA mutase family protein [Terriglobales bacterium]|jgi:methylmalonyl-CoA mutase
MAANNLMQEFPPVSTQSWEEAIRKDLKGADYAKKLVWQTDEGLGIKPYYRAEDIAGLEYLDNAPGHFPYVRGTRATNEWRIREEIVVAGAAKANHAACTAVSAGAEEIAFSHIAIKDAADLKLLLANLGEIPIHFPDADEDLIRLLMEGKTQIRVSAGFDPLTNLDFAAKVIAGAPSTLVPFTISGGEFEESGATAVQEIGFTLAAGIDFLAEMQSRGIDINRAVGSITFSFAIGSSFFFQIAKLRAFRMLWARAVESFGGTAENAKARIHARTSRWNETIYDPHVNILRGTTEAMSAAIGGADSISVAPFDECYKSPDEASRRMARNTQILLKQEALLCRVSDPGGGSYCIEVITDFLASEGWKAMQAIEAVGGYRRASAEGQIRQALEKSLAAKEKAVLIRRQIFTGTNQHANLAEKALDRIDESLPKRERRATEMYEQLRLRTERAAAETGKTPRILLAEIGDVKMRSARSSFAANFIGCAGFEIVTQRFDSVDGITEIAKNGTDMIVLCSSDPEYPALATDLIARLTALNCKIPVVVAGYPDSVEQLKSAGVADFVHVRSNPIELLTKWQHTLGIKS